MLGCVDFIYILEIIARILSNGVSRDRLCGTDVCMIGFHKVCLFVCLVEKDPNSKTSETLPLVALELYPRRSCFQHESHLESTPSPAKVGLQISEMV